MALPPKHALVEFILTEVPADTLRQFMNISETTNLRGRLLQFTKAELVAIVRSRTSRTQAKFVRLGDAYPLRAAPALYLVHLEVFFDPTANGVELAELAAAGRAGGEEGLGRAVRIVYAASGLQKRGGGLYEADLAYERRLEFLCGDPDDPAYGKLQTHYSLESALLVLSNRHRRFAVLACSDRAAVGALMSFLRARVSLPGYLPNLPQDLMRRIAETGVPRSATFSTLPDQDVAGPLDVRTMTLSDVRLSERHQYSDILADQKREQSTGFYMSHPGVPGAGLGITRREGRVWTPAHLDRSGLLRLAASVIGKTERDLVRIAKDSPGEYSHVASGSHVLMGRSRLTGIRRELFDRLVGALATAVAASDGTAQHSAKPLSLIEEARPLGLTGIVDYFCEACQGYVTATCRICGGLLSPKVEDRTVVGVCPRGHQNVPLNEEFECECGQPVSMPNPASNCLLFPLPELTEALERHFAGALGTRVGKPEFFVIRGTEVAIVRAAKPGGRQVDLSELAKWDRARVAYSPDESLRVLMTRGKEKCTRRDGQPPDTEFCSACGKQHLGPADLERNPICLQRVFGIPIGEMLDGIHHGREGADIQYDDTLDGVPVRVALHVKSRYRGKQQELGRTIPRVRELYTQLVTSLWMAKNDHSPFDADVFGVAIPNQLLPDAVVPMSYVVRAFGRSLGLPRPDRHIPYAA